MAEIPIWLNGTIRWVSGVDRKTTCRDVVEVLVLGEGLTKSNVKDFAIVERWRRVERTLDENSKILKVWTHWGDEKKEVRLCLKRTDSEVDSGRGSPVGAAAAVTSLRRRKRSRIAGKSPWSHQETLHPRRLAELGGLGAYTEEEQHPVTEPLYESRRVTNSKQEPCTSTGLLHSTLLHADHAKPATAKCCSKKTTKHKGRKSENIEKLMKLILAQGATIQTQLQKLKDREEQIETMEHERHKERLEKNGRNYLLETYLGSLGEAEAPPRLEEDEKGNDSGVHTEAGSDQMNRLEHDSRTRRGRLKEQNEEENKCPRSRSESRTPNKQTSTSLKRTKSEITLPKNKETAKDEEEDFIELKKVQSQVELWEKVFKINKKLEKEEENLVRLHISIRRCQTENMKIAKEIESRKASETIDDANQSELRTTQKTLETLSCDLDQNSKEIYKNFTQLMEEDEEAENKQKYLTKLMSDLERTDQENGLLEELLGKQTEEHLTSTSFSSQVPQEGLSLQVKGQEILPKPTICQREDTEEVKPKTLTISFHEQPDVAEEPDRLKEPPSTVTAVKGILKNNKTKVLDLEKISTNHGSNLDQQCDKVAETKEIPPGIAPPPSGYQIYGSAYSTRYNNPIYGENPYRYAFNGRSSFSRKNDSYQKATKLPENAVQFPMSTVVTTKAVVHNDTDSSTSSDTSGLSSMYSSSPTVEEHYGDGGYLLNTLV